MFAGGAKRNIGGRIKANAKTAEKKKQKLIRQIFEKIDRRWVGNQLNAYDQKIAAKST